MTYSHPFIILTKFWIHVLCNMHVYVSMNKCMCMCMYIYMYVTHEVLTVLIHTTTILFTDHTEVNFPLECDEGWIKLQNLNTSGSVTNQGQ